MPVRNQVQLITYPDSMGGNLKVLSDLLDKHFRDIFPGGVHILPPYPSSGDRGFAPRTYFEIDPQFGSWEDIRKVSEHFPVLLDLMVNHISRQSPYFQDFTQKGRSSPYADLFLPLDKIWPDGNPPREDVAKIFLRRSDNPFIDIPIERTGEKIRVWATFGLKDWSEQIDLDVNSPVTNKLFIDIMDHMGRQGVKFLRLDAIAFVIKKPGTSCFFVEPEIYQFLDWIGEQAREAGIELLPEVHAHYSIQQKLADHGEWVYNFVLPMLVLQTIESGSSLKLQQHLRSCSHRQFTMLDCHDGIPVQPDMDGILEIDEAQRVVEKCLEHGANISRILSEEHKKRADFDAHQINITYFSALGGDEDAYILARAIQLFAPGIPQVYYVGLLAGENDLVSVEATGEGRAINRHNYTVEEVEQALEKPVVQRLLNLIRFRNTYNAFKGEFEVIKTGPERLKLSWKQDEEHCRLEVDLAEKHAFIEFIDEQGKWSQYKL